MTHQQGSHPRSRPGHTRNGRAGPDRSAPHSGLGFGERLRARTPPRGCPTITPGRRQSPPAGAPAYLHGGRRWGPSSLLWGDVPTSAASRTISWGRRRHPPWWASSACTLPSRDRPTGPPHNSERGDRRPRGMVLAPGSEALKGTPRGARAAPATVRLEEREARKRCVPLKTDTVNTQPPRQAHDMEKLDRQAEGPAPHRGGQHGVPGTSRLSPMLTLSQTQSRHK